MKHPWHWWRRRRFKTIAFDIETTDLNGRFRMNAVDRYWTVQEFADHGINEGCKKLLFVVRKTDNQKRRARRRLVGGRR